MERILSQTDFNNLAEDVSNWFSKMKVKETSYGRFRMSKSAYHAFSLDASSLAADLCYMLAIQTTEAEKDEQANFFNDLQAPETGFYHEPFVNELEKLQINRVVEMSGTYFGFQLCGALEVIDRLPRYPFRFYEFTLRKSAITEYLETKFPWNHSPWGAGGWIDSIATMLRMNIKMGYKEYQLPLDEMIEWLQENQNPETGLWGNLDSPKGLTGLVNGGYHILRGTFFQMNMDIPYPERIIDACINVYKENDYFKPGNGEGCHDLDLFDLMLQASKYSPAYKKEEISRICEERFSEILSFQNKDGAFSFFPHKAQTEHNYYKISPGKEESDMQGTVFYMQTLKRISEHLGITFNIKRSKTHGYA